jgi:hypothetical protein
MSGTAKVSMFLKSNTGAACLDLFFPAPIGIAEKCRVISSQTNHERNILP